MTITTKINNFDLLLIISIVSITILNPLTGQYVLLGINYALDYAMQYGSAIISAPIAYVIGYAVYKLAPKALNIPKKGSKLVKG